MYKEKKKKKVFENAEFFASEHGWECVGENNQVSMFKKTIDGKWVRLNVYPNGTIHPIIDRRSQKSYKKASDKVLENIFADPFKNPYEQKSIPVPVSEKSNEKKMIPVQELIQEIRDLKQRVADLEQAFADSKIIPFDI